MSLSSGNATEDEVVEMLAEEGLNATPDAVAEIASHDDVNETVRRLVESCDAPVVTREKARRVSSESVSEFSPDDVSSADKPLTDDVPSDETDDSNNDSEPTHDPPDRRAPTGSATNSSVDSPTESPSDSPTTSTDSPTGPPPPSEDPDTARTDGAGATSDDVSSQNVTSGSPSAPGTPPSETPTTRTPSEFDIRNDITGESTCTGEYSDFVGYFRDRFNRLSKLLRSRIKPRSIESAESGGKDVALVGMVNEVRTTSSDRDNRLVEMEDPTGTIRLLLSDELVGVAETLVVDEVIGVEGRLSDDGGMVFVDEVHFPEVPPRREPNTASRDAKAVLVSDIHVGSDTFVGDRWDLFADWLADRPDVEYVLVAGDLVEGVGIYPDQDEELTTVDIHEQYRDCAERFAQLPDDVEIITITGNHDSVRLAEPQPALDERFREPFGDNVSFYGNPSVVTVEGVDVMMYHGMSLNPFAESLPHVEIEDPETAMVEMLRKRHLAPMYGDVRLAPETSDYLVIDDVPDVLHTGHTHTVGAEKYRNVVTVNTGAWQGQTPYQKAMNIQPDVGYAGVLDLSTLELELKQFSA